MEYSGWADHLSPVGYLSPRLCGWWLASGSANISRFGRYRSAIKPWLKKSSKSCGNRSFRVAIFMHNIGPTIKPWGLWTDEEVQLCYQGSIYLPVWAKGTLALLRSCLYTESLAAATVILRYLCEPSQVPLRQVLVASGCSRLQQAPTRYS